MDKFLSKKRSAEPSADEAATGPAGAEPSAKRAATTAAGAAGASTEADDGATAAPRPFFVIAPGASGGDARELVAVLGTSGPCA